MNRLPTQRLSLYLLSRFARDHVNVVSLATVAMELFGGYRRYALDRFASFYQRLPVFFSVDGKSYPRVGWKFAAPSSDETLFPDLMSCRSSASLRFVA